jgi:hypothetical protein
MQIGLQRNGLIPAEFDLGHALHIMSILFLIMPAIKAHHGLEGMSVLTPVQGQDVRRAMRRRKTSRPREENDRS